MFNMTGQSVPNVKITCDLSSNVTHLDCHIYLSIFSKKTLGGMEYILD